MEKQKTQQFAKFFLKDIKTKLPKYHTEKSDIDEINFSSIS